MRIYAIHHIGGTNVKPYKQKLREGVRPIARKKRFAPNDNNLAIAYYRFSSHSQNDASIDQQRDLAHEWADAHGFKIVQ